MSFYPMMHKLFRYVAPFRRGSPCDRRT